MSKTKTPFFSIIVPVYNASSRLEILVKGLRSQTFTDFEVILVDDKSTDNSLELLKVIGDKNSNFHVISLEKNVGCGPARNAGIKGAKGQYLIFHDADDWLSREALLALKKHLVQRSFPDMTIYQYAIYDESKNLISKQRKSLLDLPQEMDGTFAFNAICESTINPAAWNKAFKRSSWGDLEFQKGYMYEDLAFIPYTCLHMKTVTYCPEAVYCYYYHSEGITYEQSDRQVVAPYEALTGLYGLLVKLPNADSYKSNFIRFALNTFYHNFYYLDRNRAFTDEQIRTYGTTFLKFCRKFSLRPSHVIGNEKGLLLLEGLLIEKRNRNLDWDVQLTLSLSDMEEIIDHMLVLSRQFDLAMMNAGELSDVQAKWLKKENRMKRRIKSLEDNIFYKLGILLRDWHRKITGK